MPPTGLTEGAGWQVGVSRTLPHPPDAVWEFISGPRGLALWLGPGADLTPRRGAPYRTAEGVTGEVRGYRERERIRVTHGSTTLQVTVSAAPDPARAVLRFHQERLAGPAERDRRRAHWRAVADAVAEALA
ncbi:SRPBCC domain-containing protein [Streptomyces sp. DSM 44917]|uniref:SRPBCC domain-containing protein n=1 Tax=Streptomyces boetiae TaxID=3075541 RepID=A0ABU2LC47_9ACTN|nr:SRPBCC domain-containing protein [Streptomyces sp. DSM 44917]MDT0309153.1 SRPBCC domain-containing protein [Streptomyces sp. DSM 44917]